jgi:hypothetical protein
MAGEANQTLAAADTHVIDEGRNDSGAESDAPTSSYSVALAIIKMADNKVPEMSDYWKKNQQSLKQIIKPIMTSVG